MREEEEKVLSMQTIMVAAFNDEISALELKRRLEAEGIPAFINDERKLQRFWFLAKVPFAGVKLEVARADSVAAERKLRELHTREGALHDAIRCPSCGSLRVEYPQMTRKFILPTLVAHLLHMVGLLKHQFYCDDCQLTWPSQTKVGSRTFKVHEPRQVWR